MEVQGKSYEEVFLGDLNGIGRGEGIYGYGPEFSIRSGVAKAPVCFLIK